MKFECQVEEYDRRLASIFDKAFMECHNLEGMFKLIWILGPIASRPIIQTQLWPHYENLLSTIHSHFDYVKVYN